VAPTLASARVGGFAHFSPNARKRPQEGQEGHTLAKAVQGPRKGHGPEKGQKWRAKRQAPQRPR